MNHLLCFGYGFSARRLALNLGAQAKFDSYRHGSPWKISATSRTPEGLAQISADGFSPLPYHADLELPPDISHLLISAPPDREGDPVLRLFHAQLMRLPLTWVGYLSTTGVYGDHQGGWVDEDTPLTPHTARGENRLRAEDSWLATGLPVQLFRLAGIYGPGRNALVSLRQGKAAIVMKPGQIFSRIHVADIAHTLQAALNLAQLNRYVPQQAYNVCDDWPCPPQEVIYFAAQLLGQAPPPAVNFEEASLSPMARSFYEDSKRVSNRRIKTELGVQLRYPSYREGLTALLATL